MLGRLTYAQNNNLRRTKTNTNQINKKLDAIMDKLQLKLKGIDEEPENLPPAPPASNETLRGPSMGAYMGSINANDNNPVISNPLPNLEAYYNLYQDDFKRYLCGLIDPEYAYQKGLQIKIPSPLPIPSTTFTQVSSFTIKTQGNSFWLAWNPNFSVTKSGISKFKFYRNTDPANQEPFKLKEVLANKACSCFWGTNPQDLQFHYDQLPDVEVSRMRLVSAKMKVTYRGSNENLAGKFVSCATFQPFPNVVAHDADGTGFLYFHNDSKGWYRPLPNTLINFAVKGYSNGTHLEDDVLVSDDEDRTEILKSQAVINGLWSRSMNLSEINRGITCTYLPCDVDSQVFSAPGTIRGSALSKLIDIPKPNALNPTANTFSEIMELGDQAQELFINNAASPIIDLQGGRMGFIVVGEGLPDLNTAVDVEFYYNWEILPTVTSASSMRNYASSFVPPETIFKDIMSNININDASISIVKSSDLNQLKGPSQLGSIFSWLGDKALKFAKGGIQSLFH